MAVAQPADRLAEIVDLGVGEARRRLVEQEQPRVGGHRPGELDPLERAVGQTGRRAQGVLGEAEVGEDVDRVLRQASFLGPHPERGTAPWRS